MQTDDEPVPPTTQSRAIASPTPSSIRADRALCACTARTHW